MIHSKIKDSVHIHCGLKGCRTIIWPYPVNKTKFLWCRGGRITGVPLCQFFIYIEIITNYNNKNFGLRLALKKRLKGTRKWSITTTNHNKSKQRHEPIRIPRKLLVTCWKRGKVIVQYCLQFFMLSNKFVPFFIEFIRWENSVFL